ncbi:MAG: dihydrolipoamide acetyltransferase family protein [Bacteriovorax sp.]|jgi:pyruvate dehydrogenase E2 component (dihydrolipoamide acetyltransferase)
MNYQLPMPSLGADMDEGKMVEWKIKPGDKIKKNQTIASVETTKSIVDIESFREGVVKEILAHEGDVIHVGKPIAVLEIEGDEILDKAAVLRPKISPAAKKMAEENHIDLSTIKGSGSEGEILLKDIESQLKTKTQTAYFGVNLRDAISALMSRSKKEIPHYYLKKRIQLDSLITWLDEKNKMSDPEERILLPALLMRAVIISLKKFPELNGFYKSGKFEAANSVNLGIAISIKGGGVMAPAVIEAEKMNTATFNKAVQNLALRTKEGGLKNRELTEGTITVTNVGDLGSDEVYGVIFHPQVAIVGFGRIRKEPVVDHNNELKAGFVVDITLSADHRVSDGLLGARFLNELGKILNEAKLLEKENE